MISAELQYNPYLLETDVKFNGLRPKINSQIEKYENQLLSDWVKCVPKIFYDEMNGYDFDLYFSGTEYDFQKLIQAFEKIGVSSEQVRLIMRNELEDAEIKSNEIRDMINWLREERNRQFDFDSFYDENKELFEETFSCLMVRGMDEATLDLPFSLENVKSINEIARTNLTYVPVIFVVEESVNVNEFVYHSLTNLFAISASEKVYHLILNLFTTLLFLIGKHQGTSPYLIYQPQKSGKFIPWLRKMVSSWSVCSRKEL